MIRTLADALSLKFSRIQFTPDLMPSDITGTEILQETEQAGRRAFEFQKGPVFAILVLAERAEFDGAVAGGTRFQFAPQPARSLGLVGAEHQERAREGARLFAPDALREQEKARFVARLAAVRQQARLARGVRLEAEEDTTPPPPRDLLPQG